MSARERVPAGVLRKLAAREFAVRRLDGAEATGLAVVIMHTGADGDYVIVRSWLADYLTRVAVFVGPAGEPGKLRPAPAGLGPCVWEAAVLAHERTAFVGHVLTGVERRLWAWTRDVLPRAVNEILVDPGSQP